MGLARGDVVVVALAGDYGKPRLAVIVQSDLFEAVESVIVVPLTSELHTAIFRLRVRPSPQNGLVVDSDLMVDKMSAVSRGRVAKKIGRLGHREMNALSVAIAIFLGFDAALRPS